MGVVCMASTSSTAEADLLVDPSPDKEVRCLDLARPATGEGEKDVPQKNGSNTTMSHFFQA